MGVVLGGVTFGQVMEGKVIALLCCIAVPCLEQADDVFAAVTPPVGTFVSGQSLRRHSGIRVLPGTLHVGIKAGITVLGYVEVAR